MDCRLKSDFLHSLFLLKSLLAAEFGKSDKTDPLNLSMPEYVLAKKVAEAQSGNTDLTEIREYLAISKAAISQMLSTLEKRGLIIREIDPQNRRNLIVSITPAGGAALQRKDAEVNNRITKIISRMGQQNALQFVQLIKEMNDALKASSEKTGGHYDN